MQNQENSEPGRSESLAFVYGTKLLQENYYAKLGVDDLVSQGILRPNQKFSDFIVESLAFESSLQEEAFNWLTDDLPPPMDTSDLPSINDRRLLSKAEENDIRKSHMLREESTALAEIKREADLTEFAALVVDNLGLIDEDGDQSVDPRLLTENLRMLEKVLKFEPNMVRIGGKEYFAMYRPRESDPTLVGAMVGWMIPPSIDDYFVVSDPTKASEISSYIYIHQPLLKYFLAKQLGRVQDEKIRNLERVITGAALKKVDEIAREVDAINLPARIHFFELVQAATKSGPIHITEIFRDFEDIASLLRTRKPRADRVGAESSFEIFTVSSIEDDQLEFSFDYRHSEFVTREVEGKVRLVEESEIQPRKIRVRLNREKSILQFGEIKREDQAVDWLEDRASSGPTYKVYDLFDAMRVLEVEDRIKHGVKVKDETEGFTKQLLKTDNLIDFFAELRHSKIYPGREFLVNPSDSMVFEPAIFPPARIKDEKGEN